jgi:tetratricopeptide (TPR) repeat protein
MTVVTVRWESRQSIAGLSHVREIALERLPSEHMLKLLGLLTESRTLPDAMCHQVVERSDGNPLFLEEQIKTIYETAGASGLEKAIAAEDAHQELDIPRSLRGLLTARLDRLTVGKTVAQIAAVIGREFPVSVLSAVTLLSKEDLDNGLGELTRSGIIQSSGGTTYAFRHSLLHEAAYQILLRSRRQDYHREIARAYLSELPRVADTQPEIVAHHFQMAGAGEGAARYWYLAGTRAREQSAYREAASHFRKSLRQLETLPAASRPLADEIRTTVALGSTLIATQGYAAPEVRTVYYRASELSEKSGDPRELIASLNGLLAFLQVRGPLSEALALATRIVALATSTRDHVLIAGAYRRLGWCCFCYGRIGEGREHLAYASRLYDPAIAQTYVDVHNADPGVLGSINLAWVEWFGGDVDRAREHARRSREAARELGHPLSLAYALTMSAAVMQGLDDVEATYELATEAIELSARNAFAYWRAWATTLQGWAMTRKGQPEDGLKTMLDGLHAYEETGAQLFKPYVLAQIADAHRLLGRYSEGLAFLDEAASCARNAEVRFYDAEILRIRGELAAGLGDHAAAERLYQEAMELATKQGAGSLRLRIAANLHEAGR